MSARDQSNRIRRAAYRAGRVVLEGASQLAADAARDKKYRVCPFCWIALGRRQLLAHLMESHTAEALLAGLEARAA